MEIEQQG
jgi:Gamma tubulin complex component C-terminal